MSKRSYSEHSTTINPAHTQELACFSCGSNKINTVRMPSYHTHHAALKCGECDRFIRWEPKPTTITKRQQQQQMISELLQAKGLTDWQREFLESVRSKDKLSPRQQKVLAQIKAQMGGVAL